MAGVARAGEEGGEWKMIQLDKDLGMMGRRQATPGWSNDPVREQNSRQGRERSPPPRKTSGGGRKCRSMTKKHSYIKISDGA